MCKAKRRAFLLLSCGSAMTFMAQVAHAQAVGTPAGDGQGTIDAQPAAGASSPTAQAQVTSTTEPESPSGDIIVTAQKRAERLQDVPMSITATSGDQLKTLGVTAPDQLERVVPGFSVNRTQFGLPVFFMRGVGFNDAAIGVSPSVSVYSDQLPIPFTAMARGATLDLERVEALKGPQGTLFGQNSTGGAINFIAAKPTNELAGGFDLQVGRFNQVYAEAFVSGPISDTLSARVAVRNEYRGDWQRGYTVDQSIGEQNFQNGRLILAWRPGSTVRIELSANAWQDKSDSQQPQFVLFQPPSRPSARPIPPGIINFPPAPRNARAAAWDTNRDFQQDNWYYQFGGRADIDLSDQLTLTSLTSYAQYSHELPTDLDATTFTHVVATNFAKIRSFSQELRLSGSLVDDRFRWMVGGNYQADRVDERLAARPIQNSVTRIGPVNFDSYFLDNLQDVKTKSVFGSADFKFSDQFEIQGSVRYTDQERDYRGCTRDTGDGTLAAAISFLATALSGSPKTVVPGTCTILDANFATPPIVTGSLDEDNLSWRVSLNWTPNRDLLFYGNVTQGYKSGSFPTLPALFVPQIRGVKQESVLAYEIGTKMEAFDRKVQINGALFYYDYTDKQLSGFVNVAPLGTFPTLVSIPKTTVKGGEVSIAVRPVEGLTLSANATYVKTRIDENPINPIGTFGNPANFVGQEFSNTPNWQAVADAQYRFPVGAGLNAYVGASATYRSATSSAILSGDPALAVREELLRIPGYTLVDLRAGVELNDGDLRFEVWGRNVTDKFYLIGSARASDIITRYTGMPATYGASLSFRY